MTVSNGKSVRQILEAVYSQGFSDARDDPTEDDMQVDEALAALEEIMEGAKPEELLDIVDGKYYPFGAGYNAGLKDYEQNLKQTLTNSN